MKGNQVKATTRNRFFHRHIIGVRMTEGNEKGVVLILTLAIVLILAVLVMEFRYLATIELQSAASFGEEIKAAYLAKSGISIASVTQKQRHKVHEVPIVMIIHEAKEKSLRAALEEINRLGVIKEKSVAIRIEEL